MHPASQSEADGLGAQARPEAGPMIHEPGAPAGLGGAAAVELGDPTRRAIEGLKVIL